MIINIKDILTLSVLYDLVDIFWKSCMCFFKFYFFIIFLIFVFTLVCILSSFLSGCLCYYDTIILSNSTIVITVIFQTPDWLQKYATVFFLQLTNSKNWLLKSAFPSKFKPNINHLIHKYLNSNSQIRQKQEVNAWLLPSIFSSDFTN